MTRKFTEEESASTKSYNSQIGFYTISNDIVYEVGHEDGYSMGRDVERSYWLQKLQEFINLEIERRGE